MAALLWLTVALTPLCALAESGVTLRFTIHADPPGTGVYWRCDPRSNPSEKTLEKYLGGCNREMVYTVYPGPGGKMPAELNFTLRADGYRDTQVRINYGDLEANPEFPSDRHKIELEPTTVTAKMRCFAVRHGTGLAVGLAGVAVALLYGLGLARTRARSRMLQSRNTRLETLQEFSLTSEDPLVKDIVLVGGYRLVEVLGNGGMATVYRALPDGSLDDREEVAIKLIRADLMGQPTFLDRFRREVKITRDLRHPNIVGLLDYGEAELQGKNRAFMVMELVRGRTLRDRLEQEWPDQPTALKWLESVARAVDYANQLGITHRDLKPENLMLTEQGRLLVMDFGIAKSEDSQKLTETGDALGTPAYMAPEQIQTNILDPRTDQYAFGIMAYELLTGVVPFRDATPIQVIMMHVQRSPEPPSRHRSDLPPQVDAVILRMLAKSPEDRFPHLEEAMTALRSAFQ